MQCRSLLRLMPLILPFPLLLILRKQTAYDASDIWSQQSTMNEDLFLLQYKQELEHNLEKVGVSLNQRPILEISGAIEGDGYSDF